MSEHTDSAIVVGASIGGLLAARVLSVTHARVTVVERDVLADGAVHRRGVPQSRHAHGLLARGREALEELFPGLTAELTALGVPAADLQSGFRWVNAGRLLCQAPSGLVGLGVSRALLESRVRARVRALLGVGIADGCAATGLAVSADGRRVTGLRVVRAGGAAEVLGADLVVDATGRGSRAPSWLESLGYPAPEVDEVPIGLAYASRAYRRDASGPDGAAIAGTPADPRGGVMIAQEDDRWIVSVGGILGDAAPLDHAGFTAFTATLPSPLIHEVVRDAEPLGDAVRFRFPASSRRRYERLGRFPEGFLVMGDAVASFDPVYGQGMSVAAVEALALRRCLDRGTEDLAHRFFRAAATVIDSPWRIAVGGDLRFPGVPGPRTRSVRAVNAYLERLHVAAEHDPAVGRAFLRVVSLLDPPQRLFAPGTALRVMRGTRSAALTGGSPVRHAAPALPGTGGAR
ncbi:hypothetical protein GCU56_00975 [Geodermatophilus sabuli]|uniref:2-polyprenyl-6-methoxyphenol hydroxylase n=1 Tax=Geodermatophilus sabuli TaxID=1564158 RepID=A0A7K3VXU2_9ACTN|nr:hypothetical protein [Geodermatophilus sabuli]NEK56447.1 hypothetical protein [Geodermatophilus sabuli]